MRVFDSAGLSGGSRGRNRSRKPPNLLFAHSQHFHDHSLSPLSVEFRIENPLPGTQVELAIGNRQGGFVMEKQRLQMCVGVVLARPMMLVFRPRRRQFFQPLVDVFNKAVFEIIHINGRGNVHRRNETQSVLYTAAAHNLFHLIGDVDHFAAFARLKRKILGMAFHHASPPNFSTSIYSKRFAARNRRQEAIILKIAMADSGPIAGDVFERGLRLLDAGAPSEAARAFRAVIAADPAHVEAYHGLIRALRDAGRIEASVGAALALTVIAPHDPATHTALSISLRAGGHMPQAEAAAARAQGLERKMKLESPPAGASPAAGAPLQEAKR